MTWFKILPLIGCFHFRVKPPSFATVKFTKSEFQLKNVMRIDAPQNACLWKSRQQKCCQLRTKNARKLIWSVHLKHARVKIMRTAPKTWSLKLKSKSVHLKMEVQATWDVFFYALPPKDTIHNTSLCYLTHSEPSCEAKKVVTTYKKIELAPGLESLKCCKKEVKEGECK